MQFGSEKGERQKHEASHNLLLVVVGVVYVVSSPSLLRLTPMDDDKMLKIFSDL